MTTPTRYTIDSILKSLGYADPMVAARQQARMILLGRLAHYQAVIQQLQSKWGMDLPKMREQYEQEGVEIFAADDDYLEWQWYDEAMAAIKFQLEVLAKA